VRRSEVVSQIRDRLPLLDYAPVAFTSALTRSGLPELFDLIDRVGEEATKKVPSALLTKVVTAALERRPTTHNGIPFLMQSASQVAVSPPTFVLRVNLPDQVHFSYERYLANSIRQAFGFSGSPIRLSFRRVRMGKARR
jgi:GTP-binding protein